MTRLRSFLLLSILTVLLGITVLEARSLLAASALQQLTTDPATDVRPAWSPDGQQIAFQSNRSGSYGIWLMDISGNNQREVSSTESDDRHPAWSPDGQQLAFDSDASGHREIWIVDGDGQNLRQLTSLEARSSFPAWSPDGTQISFYVYQEGIMDLWVGQADGSDFAPLTSTLADERSNQCTFACHQAAWSPDGQKIAFEGGDHQSIWVMNADGSDSTELVAATERSNFPWYTGDGHIVYLTEHVNPHETWTDAWSLDPATGDVTLLLDRIQLQGPVEWSPDETKLLFFSPRSGNFDIFIADLAAEGGREALQAGPDSTTSLHSALSEMASEESDPAAAAPDMPADPEAPAAEVDAASSSLFPASVIVGVVGLVAAAGLILGVMALKRRKRRA